MENTNKKPNRKWSPYITYYLIALNVMIFIAEELLGGSEDIETSIAFGAFYTPYVIVGGQFYRFITSMFLHFGVEHLGSNMISLFFLGPYVEHYYGHFLYLVLYIFSGISGNMLTMLYEGVSNSFAVSAGASGAIFGLLSVFILFATNPRLRKMFPIKRILFSVALSLAAGFTDPSINFMAHAGGFAGGLVLAFIMQEIIRFNVRKRRQ
jgi:rhomboid protease GluP